MKNNKPSKKDNLAFYTITFLITILIVALYNMGISHYYLGWIAFAVAAFSVAGNDAIQTIGTFIESKRKVHWLPKAVILCGLMILVHIYAFTKDGGEIHFNRLNSIPPANQFTLIQLTAPIILVIITRLRAPISTTFLILGLFSGNTGTIEKMLNKSFLGYGIAFITALLFWGLHSFFFRKEYMKNFVPKPKKEKKWAMLQWLSTAFLWIAWLLQDTANIAVFLPRKLSLMEFTLGMSILCFALSYILFTNGGTIQDIVTEKSDITYSKAATLVDLSYALILFLFQYISNIPMSTTWVFLGLLAGREIILHIITKKDKPYLQTFRQVGKDVVLATLGITVSLGIYFLNKKIYTSNPKVEEPTKIEINKDIK